MSTEELDQKGYIYKTMLLLDGGIDLENSVDMIEENMLSSGDNIRVQNNVVTSDTGYDSFLGAVRGAARLEYQFQKNNGSLEDLLITNDTFYKKVGSQWQYVSNGVDTLVNGARIAGESTIVVDDTTGFTNGHYIGITLDDGTQHQTTIAAAPFTEIITNTVDRDFSAAGNWTLGTGITVAAGVMAFAGVLDNVAATLTAGFMLPDIVIGQSYVVVFTISGYAAEGVRVLVGSTGAGTTRTANGTYTQTIVAAGSTQLKIQAKGGTPTTLNIDIISVTLASGGAITITDAIPVGRSVDDNAPVLEPIVLTGTVANQVHAVTMPANDWVVFTNNTDVVKRYDGTTVETVPNMVSSGNCKCRALGILEHHLLLLNTTEGGTNWPQRIRRSDTADPTEWVLGNAGYEDQLDNSQAIVTGANLGPYFIVYKEDSILRMEYVGSSDQLFNIDTLVSGQGCRSVNGVAIIDKSKHAVIGIDSVYLYTGGFDYEDISGDVEPQIFGSLGEIAASTSHLSIVAYCREHKEIMVFYATSEATTYPDKMARFNIKKTAWTFRMFFHEVSGVGLYVNTTSTPWSTLVGSWIQQTFRWGSATISGSATLLQLCCNTQVYSYNYLEPTDAGEDIDWKFATGAFTSPYYEFRHDLFEFMARGSTVTVDYSKDYGNSWITLKVVTLTSAFFKYRITKQFIAQNVMYRFTGTGPGFSLRWIGFKFINESGQRSS